MSNSNNISNIDGNEKKRNIYRRMKHKKNITPPESDDDSVDSHGNIQGLIDYDCTDDVSSTKHHKKSTKKPRKAALKAMKKIHNKLQNEKLEKKKANKKQKYIEESEDISDTSSDSSKSEEDDENVDDMTDTDVEESSEEDIEEESEEESEYDEDDDDYSDDDEYSGKKSANFLISFGGGNQRDNVPVRHNMKKESTNVKNFVKLLTRPIENDSIDSMIDDFKKYDNTKQAEVIKSLELRPSYTDTSLQIMVKILSLNLPKDIQNYVFGKYNLLQQLDPSSGEYFKTRNWIDKVISVPFGKYIDFPTKIEDGTEKCTQFMKLSKSILDSALFGQEEPKLQIMQFISTRITNPANTGINLLLVGPPGIGKTSLVKNGIAKALGWPYQFISLGGDSDASTFTGHQLVYESSHCGKIVNSLVTAKSMNCVILFDEVDKISMTPKGEEIQNMLIHLTDPQTNNSFEDKYLSGIPIDLSKCIFIFSANDITKIDKVLLDRLVVINMDGYTCHQKLDIAKKYIVPTSLEKVGLVEKLDISNEILSYIIEKFSYGEKGVRQLKRNIDQICEKVNMLRMFNVPDIPFYIKGFRLPFVIEKDHVDLFLKRNEPPGNFPPFGMYM